MGGHRQDRCIEGALGTGARAPSTERERPWGALLRLLDPLVAAPEASVRSRLATPISSAWEVGRPIETALMSGGPPITEAARGQTHFGTGAVWSRHYGKLLTVLT